MKIKMKLLTDTIFGDGMSVPGGEDISVLHDAQGFPYFKGSSFKGIFREELERYLSWTNAEDRDLVNTMLGKIGDEDELCKKITFSDFELSDSVKNMILTEVESNPDIVLQSLTNLRTFTAIDMDGIVKTGSLRMARCVNKNLTFYSEIDCDKEQSKIIKEVLPLIKWIGSMRNRGFGKVRVDVD